MSAVHPSVEVLAQLRQAAPLTQSLPEQIAARLSERIVSGAYAPGQRIMEQAVAEEFEVSRGPVREALRLLEKDGLVMILPRRGAQVTNPSIEEVNEIFDIRAMLNGLRDRLIAERPNRTQLILALEQGIAKLAETAATPGPGDDYIDIVLRLNRLLTQDAGNHRLQTILGSLAVQTVRYTRLGLSTPQRRLQSVRNWQSLLQAIREGDGDAAERIARQRVIDSRDAAVEHLRSQTA
ncbi:MAG: GntR family transcriptional regulator [Burkholderiales bacterium]|nr:GntR family transcriptional regulator [Burkholderiales bacterium]